jgi:hypothetical protein
MSEATTFIIGSEVSCTDGVCGDLRRVVVDPIARAITHLVSNRGIARARGTWYRSVWLPRRRASTRSGCAAPPQSSTP